MLYTNGRADANRARHDAATAAYMAEVASWQTAKNERTRCEQRVEARAGSRAQAEATVRLTEDVIRIIDASVGGLDEDLSEDLTVLFEARRENIDVILPELYLKDCPPDPGDRPEPPEDIAVILIEGPSGSSVVRAFYGGGS